MKKNNVIDMTAYMHHIPGNEVEIQTEAKVNTIINAIGKIVDTTLTAAIAICTFCALLLLMTLL